MAHEILKRYGNKVRVVTRPPYHIVVQEWGGADWRDVGEYHRVSDDYAFTNAYEHAERHACKLETPADMPLVRTDDVLAPHHLMELFTGTDEADDGEYYGPDLDECDTVQVCGGEWRLEPDGLWRFWSDQEFDD